MLTPTEQFIIQLATIIAGFVVTLATLFVKHQSDMSQRDTINRKVDNVAQAVDGLPNTPTIKEQTTQIQATLRGEVLPRIADTNVAVHDAATKADTAAQKADTAAQKADTAAQKADTAATLLQQQKEG